MELSVWYSNGTVSEILVHYHGILHHCFSPSALPITPAPLALCGSRWCSLLIHNSCGNSLPPFWCVTAIPFPLQMRSCTYARDAWSGRTFAMSMGGPSTLDSYKTEQRIHQEVIFYEVYCPFCWSSSCQAYAMASALDLSTHRLCSQQSVA